MYNTSISRTLCILDGYSAIIDSYQRNFAISVSEEFHLSIKEAGFYLQRNPESLHNLKSEPAKAYEIICLMKCVLTDNCNEVKNINLLETLLTQRVLDKYKNETDALLFVKSVISRVIELATDDSQFSEFSYF